MKKRELLLTGVILAIAAIPGICRAEQTTGQMLAKSCKEAVRYYDTKDPTALDYGLYCMGVCTGIVTSELMNHRLSRQQGGHFCLSVDDYSIERMTRVIAYFGETHPERLRGDAAVTIMVALPKAYPCPEQ